MSEARACAIIAGGASRRFGTRNKLVAKLDGLPLIEHVIRRVQPQATALAINSAPVSVIASLGVPVIKDVVAAGLGPLAGVLTAMRWAQSAGYERVFTVPGDTPFLPVGLLARLDLPDSDIVLSSSAGRPHPICARWNCSLASALETDLIQNGVRAVNTFADRHGPVIVEFDFEGIDPFFNVNTREDFALAGALLSR